MEIIDRQQRLETLRRRLGTPPDLATPQPTLASVLLDWAGQKLGGRAGSILRRLGELLKTSPLESVSPAPPVAGAIYDPVRKTVGPLYHGTSTRVLQRILKEGLRPSSETGRQVFQTSKPAVYLARNPLAATYYAGEAVREFGGRGAVLKVREVPTKSLAADEDLALIWSEDVPLPMDERTRRLLGQILRRSGVARTGELWRLSFRLPSEMARELGVSGGIRGTGTVAYRGVIPPEQIEVLEVRPVRIGTRWKETEAEWDRLINLLREVRARYKRTPWWLD